MHVWWNWNLARPVSGRKSISRMAASLINSHKTTAWRKLTTINIFYAMPRVRKELFVWEMNSFPSFHKLCGYYNILYFSKQLTQRFCIILEKAEAYTNDKDLWYNENSFEVLGISLHMKLYGHPNISLSSLTCVRLMFTFNGWASSLREQCRRKPSIHSL